MECPSCNADIPADSNFCPFCGLPILLRDDEPEVEDVAIPATIDADTDTSELVVTAERGRVVSRPRPTSPADPPTERIDRTGAQTAKLLACARCGARNGPLRSACARCGKPLARDDDPTSAQRPVPARAHERPSARARRGGPSVAAAEPVPGPGDDEPGRPVSAGTIVFLVGAVLGTALGLVAWLVFGTDGGTEPAAAPTFDRGVYVSEPADVDVDQVRATSTLPPGPDGPHDPELAVDGDPTTAWIEGAEGGSGRGEGLTLRFTAAAWVKSFTVRNGYQRDAEAFGQKARARRLRASFDDGTEYVIVLADVDGVQDAQLPDPVLTRTVELEILDVHGGDDSDELAISELRVGGWRARGADRQAPHLGRSPAR